MNTPTEPNELNRDLINSLAMDSATIYHWLVAYKQGWLTYEQSLIGMVSSLVNHNDELTKLQIKRLELSAEPVYLIKQDIK